ncbi:MAG: hypothetical protein WAM90_12715 [Rhodanobacter sp.]
MSIRLRWIIPFLGYREMSIQQTVALDLDQRYVWQSFEAEWLGIGVTFWVRAKGFRV